jgi:hypothetical protein
VPGSGGAVAQPRLGSVAGAEALIKSLEPPAQPAMGAIPAPVFTAGPVMPQVRGMAVPQTPSFGAPVPPPDVQDTIREAAALRRDAPAQAGSDSGIPGLVIPGTEGSDGGGLAAGGKSGKVKGSPRDRPGVRTKPRTVNFVKKVAGIYGQPITLGTGTAHSRMTASGNVSQHWSGDALDLPAAGEALTRMGRAALVAAGMPRSRARKAKGGIYNVNGYQIIFNAADHYDHLHVGP